MSEAHQEDNGNQDDFDAAYEEFIGAEEPTDEADQAAEETTGAPEDDTSDDDATPEQDSGSEGGATEAEAEAGESEQALEAEQAPEEDLEKLKQKLKSAEGRLSKFEENVAEMREKLEQSQEKPPETPENNQQAGDQEFQKESEFVPPGMDKDDWLDLQEDYPDTAKMLKEKFQKEQTLEQENRSLKEQQAEEAEEFKAREAFRQHILNEHPDYDTEILPRMDDLKAFIAEQSSAVQKQQYERIFEAGTAAEVSALVTDYKAARGQSTSTPTDTPNAKKRIDSALAVPNKGGSNPNLNKGKVDMDDFDAAYEEALNSDLD